MSVYNCISLNLTLTSDMVSLEHYVFKTYFQTIFAS